MYIRAFVKSVCFSCVFTPIVGVPVVCAAWAGVGTSICPATEGNLWDLELTSDRAGGAIITWPDNRDRSDWNI